MVRVSEPDRPRRWFVVITVAWVLILVGTAGWAIVHGRPTAREQTTINQALPAVDEATARLARAADPSAGPGGAASVVAVSGFDRVGACTLTVARVGQVYQRVVTVFTGSGVESAVLDRIGRELPAAYQVQVSTVPVARLAADAGDFVRVNGAVTAPGRLRFVVDTGCRAPGRSLPVDPSTTHPPTGPIAATVRSALLALGAPASSWTVHRIDCAGTGMQTVEAVADGVGVHRPEVALGGLPGASAVLTQPDLYAYRLGGTGLAVRLDGAHLVVTASSPC
jgi:hypothetical protein